MMMIPTDFMTRAREIAYRNNQLREFYTDFYLASSGLHIDPKFFECEAEICDLLNNVLYTIGYCRVFDRVFALDNLYEAVEEKLYPGTYCSDDSPTWNPAVWYSYCKFAGEFEKRWKPCALNMIRKLGHEDAEKEYEEAVKKAVEFAKEDKDRPPFDGYNFLAYPHYKKMEIEDFREYDREKSKFESHVKSTVG